MGRTLLKILLSVGAVGVVLAVAVTGSAMPVDTPPLSNDPVRVSWTFLDVPDHIVISPSSGSIVAGSSQGFTVEGFSGATSTGDVTSSATFSITPDGSCAGGGPSCTATAPGLHTVTATVDGMTDTASLTVTVGSLDHIVVSPPSATITAGGSQAFTAQGFDSSNNSLGDVTAGTSFSITPNGSCGGASCTATLAGAHTVTGSNGGASDTSSLTVNAGALDHIVISPSTATVTAGTAQAYTAEGFDSANNSLGNVAATYSITNGSCSGASCSAAAPGAHTVTGSSGGKSDTATLNVTLGPLDHIVVSPSTATVTAGTAQAYTAEGFDSANNSLGDQTSTTTFSITPDGSCSNVVVPRTCTATVPGTHTVTGTKTGKTDAAALTVSAVAPVNTVAPAVTDLTPTLAQVLTYTAGTWTGYAPPTVTVQWCTPTCGTSLAAGATYTVQAADIGKQIFVRETAVNTAAPGGVTKDSALTAAVAGPPVSTTAPAISGTPSVGQTLTGSSGNWTASPAPTLVLQWQRCNAAGAAASCVDTGSSSSALGTTATAPLAYTRNSTYAVTNADLGSTLRLKVTAQNGVNPAPAAVFSAITQPVQAAPVQVTGQAPAVTGTLARGQTLTATSGQWTGFWTAGQPPVAFTHQWQRCAVGGTGCVNVNGDAPVAVPPTGAATCTAAAPCGGTTTYLLSDADMGSVIRVIVKATNGGGSVEVTSGLTAVVQGAPIILQSGGAPDPNAQPKINGIAQSGLNIGVSTGSWSAFPGGDAITYAVQWLRCTGTDVGSCSAIGGATATVYAVQDADVGQRIRVRVTASNGVAPPGVATSEATLPVSAKVAGGGGDGVDLLLSARSSASGARVTYTLSATNAGNQGATGVTVNVTLSGAASFVSASAPGGCSGSGPVSCTLGSIGAGASGSATIVVVASQTGVIGMSASVGAAQPDVNPSNNDVSASVYVVASGSAPKAGTGTGGTNGTGSQTAGTTTADQRFVALRDVTLKARRVRGTWVATTKFSLLSGRSDLRLIVTKNGSTKEIALQEGSRFGGVVVEGSSEEVAFTAKPGTFPIKVVLPAKGFALKQIYVIRITATVANGSSSTSLNIGFKGAPLVTKTAVAKLRGTTQVVNSTFTLPASKATSVQAWVNPTVGTRKLGLLKGSRLGKVVATSTKNMLVMKATKGGTFPLSVALAATSVSANKGYVIRVRAKSGDGLWTDYDIRFTGKSSPARVLTGTRTAATP